MAVGTPNPAKLRAHSLQVPTYEGGGEGKGWSPADLRSAYNLPSTGGKGLTVAITIAYDDPKAEEDLATYRSHYGLSACTTANGCFKKVNQKGETANYPEANANWAVETSLDLDMVSATCPECHILLVEANSNDGSDLYLAVEKAAELGVNAISDSWDGGEYEGEASSDHYLHHPGIPVLFASGDEGYETEYPAASPEVIAVGGTSLKKDKSARGWSESAWEGAGSGCSEYEEKPAWQTDELCAKRMIADVSAVADPATPVSLYDSYNQGGWLLVGGTSVASPLVAGIEALSSAEFRETGPEAFTRAGEGGKLFDPATGSSWGCGSYLCQAEVGYDGPTGWGTPNGPLSIPVAITEAAVRVSESEVTLHGAVKPGGTETEYSFEYGESTSYGTTVALGKSSSSTYVKASKTIGSLKGHRVYHYRISATRSGETFHGNDREFATTLPSANTGTASEIHANDAKLNATVNPEGLATTYYIQYGPSSAYGHRIPLEAKDLGAGSEAIAVSGTVSVLTGGWTYHFRVVAKNVAGTAYGKDATFTTAQPQWSAQRMPKPPIDPLPSTNPYRNTMGDVSCGSQDDCMAVGDYLQYLYEVSQHWDGSKWTSYPMALPAVSGSEVIIYQISCPAKDWCEAVGTESRGSEGWVPQIQHWNGSKWTIDSLPWTHDGHIDWLANISCVSQSSCMAVGIDGSSPYATPLVFQWNGTSWSALSMSYPSEDVGVEPYGVSCASSSWCMVVGSHYMPSTGYQQPIAETWNGKEWSNVKNASPNPASERSTELTDVSCATGNACSALTYINTYSEKTRPAERWNGKEWTREALPQPLGVEAGEPQSIDCPSVSFCAAVGQTPFNNGYAPVAYAWQGSSWSLQGTSITTEENGEGILWDFLNGVSCSSQSRCVAVGAYRPPDREYNGLAEVYQAPGPLAKVSPAASVRSTSATLMGTVNAAGLATTYQFEYGTSKAYGASLPASPAESGSGTEAVAVSRALHGLEPLTEYHFRLKATNSQGTTYSEDRTFKTREAVPPHFSSSFGELGSAEGRLNEPYGIALDAEDNVWIADSENSRVEEFSPSGKLLHQVGSKGTGAGQFTEPYAVTVGAEGKVWVADSFNSRLVELSPAGSFIKAIGWGVADGKSQFETCESSCQAGIAGSGEGQVDHPYGVTADPQGNLWVVNWFHRVEEFSAAGKFVRQFDPGSGSLSDVALDEEGHLWIADYQGHIREFGAEGKSLFEFGKIGSGNGEFNMPTGLGIDPEGRIWVADSENDRVQIFNSAGHFLTKFGTSGKGEAQMDFPRDIAFDSQGNAWVADSGNSRIEKWTIPTPKATTEAASSIKGHSATLNGSVNPEGLATSYYFEYDESAYAGEATHGTKIPLSPEAIGSGTSNVAVHQTPSGLSPGTTYHFRLVAENEADRRYGEDKSFRTANVPKASTEAASSVKTNSAILNATVNPEGAATSYYFEYDKTEYKNANEAPHGTKTPLSPEAIGSGTSNVSVHQTPTGLTEKTTYHYRIVAENEAGTSYGEDKSFTTLKMPKANTNAPSSLKATSATLSATIWPEGSPTSYYFEYDQEKEYGENETASHGTKIPLEAKEAGSNFSLYNVGQTLTGLPENTTYHYRVIAESVVGTAYGKNRNFTTLKSPKATTEAATEIGTTSATLNGSINPEGSGPSYSTKYYFEYDETEYKGEASHGEKIPLAPVSIGSGTSYVAVHQTPTDLTPGRTYHFRVVAEDFAATTWGKDVTFTTVPEAPKATTNPATKMRGEAATLNATVNPESREAAYLFEWGTQEEFEASEYNNATELESIGSGTEDLAVSQLLEGLEPEATYHFRVVAENEVGTTYGEDEEFTTAPLTALCEASPSESACPEESRYPAETALLAEASKVTFSIPDSSLACKSQIEAATQAEAGGPLALAIKQLSFTSCSSGVGSCSVKQTVGTPVGSLAWTTGSDGKVEYGLQGAAPVIRITCLTLDCKYRFADLTLKGGNPAQLSASETKLTQEGGFYCPSEGVTLKPAIYTVSAPKPVYVAKALG